MVHKATPEIISRYTKRDLRRNKKNNSRTVQTTLCKGKNNKKACKKVSVNNENCKSSDAGVALTPI